ncbi:hypothetical protein [Adlercreutzia agrestimuris]|uniref:hypothetical protein n=1 Tax=Adlercreutzia agrestimuris TaxID=2941324 RepID=UPI00203C0FE4|nr:hypothetical protein [Adlercreutzia agrestimuris]
MAASQKRASNKDRSEHFGAMQEVIESLFPVDGDHDAALAAAMAQAGLGPKVRRLDVIVAAESADLPDELMEIFSLLPPGEYTRQRLCDQLNSAIAGHAWGQVYGTVE